MSCYTLDLGGFLLGNGGGGLSQAIRECPRIVQCHDGSSDVVNGQGPVQSDNFQL